jgi:DNA-binding transcriptional MerR regulator
MRIGELARRSGLSARMLRYYEEAGLLRPARTASGYRDYGEAELEAARRIRLLGASGLTVEAIRRLLPCMRTGDGPLFEGCDEIRETLRQAVAELDAQLRTLRESRAIVASYLHELDAGAPARQPRRRAAGQGERASTRTPA